MALSLQSLKGMINRVHRALTARVALAEAEIIRVRQKVAEQEVEIQRLRDRPRFPSDGSLTSQPSRRSDAPSSMVACRRVVAVGRSGAAGARLPSPHGAAQRRG